MGVSSFKVVVFHSDQGDAAIFIPGSDNHLLLLHGDWGIGEQRMIYIIHHLGSNVVSGQAAHFYPTCCFFLGTCCKTQALLCTTSFSSSEKKNI